MHMPRGGRPAGAAAAASAARDAPRTLEVSLTKGASGFGLKFGGAKDSASQSGAALVSEKGANDQLDLSGGTYTLIDGQFVQQRRA